MVEFLPSDGAFRLSALYQPQQEQQQQQHLRMISYGRRWTRADMIMAMYDATAMQMVQASRPYLVEIANACGLSLMSEFMAGGPLTYQLAVPPPRAGRKVKYFPMERLMYAMQTAHALADVHVANIAHMDIQVKSSCRTKHKVVKSI
jgi:hypothetical protein